jgi:uncharacterized protein (TIRG00374 family)
MDVVAAPELTHRTSDHLLLTAPFASPAEPPLVGSSAGSAVHAETAQAPASPRRSWPFRLIRIALALALVTTEIVLLAPHVSNSGAALSNLRWGWVAAAIVCEMASIATFSRLRRSLLRAGGVRVGPTRMGALTLASTAISATVPAGVAVSAGYLYRQLRRMGASAPLVTWTLVAGSVVSALAFTVITIVGTVLSGGSSIDDIAGAGGLSLLAVLGFIALLTVVTRHPRPLLRAAKSLCGRLPLRRSRACTGSDDAAVERVADQITAITPRARDWTAAFLFATLNWATDLACFVLCCYAVGASGLSLGMAVLAYVAGLATTSISLLPGGLGSVDAGLLVGLTHGGVAGPVAVAGIVTYRLVAYALVAVVGWVVWAALRRRRYDTTQVVRA